MDRIPQKHVFVCINCREGTRKSCGDTGLSIRTELLQIASRNQSETPLRVNKSGCLDVCEFGPALVIYPEGIWYKNVDISDCEEIYKRSIQNNEVIDRLLLNDDDLDSSK